MSQGLGRGLAKVLTSPNKFRNEAPLVISSATAAPLPRPNGQTQGARKAKSADGNLMTSVASSQQPAAAICAGCSGAGASKTCSACSEVKYCSRDCQVAHWKHHKRSCSRKNVKPPASTTVISECIFCLDSGDTPPIQSGCACRGAAGLAHVSCRAQAAAVYQASTVRPVPVVQGVEGLEARVTAQKQAGIKVEKTTKILTEASAAAARFSSAF